MAKVTITIEDENDAVSMVVNSDPPFPGPANTDQTCTNAQVLGVVAFDAINKISERRRPRV